VPGHFSDKTLHAWLYAGLAVLLVRAVVGSRWPRTGLPSALLAVGLATVYGLADETHQLFVPGRQFDLRDLVADAIGAGVAAAAVFAWGIITRFRRFPSGRS
jgi:VanZ family protein